MSDDVARFARDLRQARETALITWILPACFFVPVLSGFLFGTLGVGVAIPLGLVVMRASRGVARGFAGSRVLGAKQVGRRLDGTPILAKPSLREYESMTAEERSKSQRLGASQMDVAGLVLSFAGVVSIVVWVLQQFAPR